MIDLWVTTPSIILNYQLSITDNALNLSWKGKVRLHNTVLEWEHERGMIHGDQKK